MRFRAFIRGREEKSPSSKETSGNPGDAAQFKFCASLSGGSAEDGIRLLFPSKHLQDCIDKYTISAIPLLAKYMHRENASEHIVVVPGQEKLIILPFSWTGVFAVFIGHKLMDISLNWPGHMAWHFTALFSAQHVCRTHNCLKGNVGIWQPHLDSFQPPESWYGALISQFVICQLHLMEPIFITSALWFKELLQLPKGASFTQIQRGC